MIHATDFLKGNHFLGRLKILILSLVLVMLLANISPVTAQNTDDDTLLLEVGRGAIRNVFWHPDGTKFYVQTQRGTLWMYDRATMEEITHIENVSYAGFTASSHWILIYRFDMVEWLLVSSKDFSPAPIKVSNFSPNGKFALNWESDGILTILDGKTLTPLANQPRLNDIGDLLWSPDSTLLAEYLGDGRVQIYKIDEQGIFTKTDLSFGMVGEYSWLWSPDSTRLMQHDSQGGGGIHDVTDGAMVTPIKQIPNSDSNQESIYPTIQWTPDSTKYILMYYANFSQTLTIIDAKNGNILKEIPTGQTGAAQFTPDGRYVIWNLGIYSTETFEAVHDIYSDITKLSPDGTKLFTSFFYGVRLYIHDVVTGQELVDIQRYPERGRGEQPAGNYNASWSPNSQEILVWEETGSFQLLDATTGQQIHGISGFAPIGDLVEFSPDSRFVFVSANNNIYIYDMNTGEEVSAIRYQHIDKIGVVLWHPSEYLFATQTTSYTTLNTSEEQSKIFIWDAITGKHIDTIDHIGSVSDFVWHPDGLYLASASNHYLSVWYLPPYQPDLQRWSDGIGDGSGLEFSPDHRFLVLHASMGAGSHGSAELVVRDAQTFEILASSDISHKTYSWNATGDIIRVAEVQCADYFPPTDCNVFTYAIFNASDPKTETKPYNFGQFTAAPRTVWSPDGSKLALASMTQLEVWEIGATEAKQLEVIPIPTQDYDPFWVRWDENNNFHITTPYPNQENRLPGWTTFSPDGKSYVNTWGGVIRLYRVSE